MQVTETGEPAQLSAGATIKPTHSFATCPPLDCAMMGAHDSNHVMSKTEIDFIRKTYDDCVAFFFICGGFLAALKSGLLEGKTATAPR